MEIFVNGRTIALSEAVTVDQFIEHKQLAPETVVVEYNNQIIKRNEWAQIVLKQGDRLEIVTFVGGG